jgi:hypothetical protein
MESEFTNFCSHYYELTLQLEESEAHFHYLLANALPYSGQTNLNELDAIIECNREVQEAKTLADNIVECMRGTESNILKIMQYFEIPPHTKLQGEIPGDVQFEIWADENDTIHILKTKDLAPLADHQNVYVVKNGELIKWADYKAVRYKRVTP